MRGGRRADGDPRRRTASAWSTCTSSTAVRTGPPSARARCWSRSASRSTSDSAARTRRSIAGSVTGRWPPPARRSTLADGMIERAGIALAAVGAEVTSTQAEQALRRPAADRGERSPQAGRLAAAACSPGDRPARLGRLQAPRRRGADRRGRCSGRPRALWRGGRDAGHRLGQRREHTREVEPRMLLVHFLRDELG